MAQESEVTRPSLSPLLIEAGLAIGIPLMVKNILAPHLAETSFKDEDPRMFVEIKDLAKDFNTFVADIDEHHEVFTQNSENFNNHAQTLTQGLELPVNFILRLNTILDENPQLIQDIGRRGIMMANDRLLRDPEILEFDVNEGHENAAKVASSIAQAFIPGGHSVADLPEQIKQHRISLTVNYTAKTLGIESSPRMPDAEIETIRETALKGISRRGLRHEMFVDRKKREQLNKVILSLAISKYAKMHAPQENQTGISQDQRNILGMSFLRGHIDQRKAAIAAANTTTSSQVA